MFNIQLNLKIILYTFLFILHLIIIWFIYCCFTNRNQKTLNYYDYTYTKINNNQYLENRQLVAKIAYLGLEQFFLGLKDNTFKDTYQTFLKSEKPPLDMEIIIEKILNQKLNTAYPFLIQSTIDFLSKKINKRISLIIEIKNSDQTTFSYDFNSLFEIIDSSILKLEMKNFNNVHFYIKEYNDTPGDGYCFFHALKYLLDENIPNWLDLIGEDLKKSPSKVNIKNYK
ncbi:hypothetical protein OC686_01890 ['Opuntia sp.' phytoplasma]|uniref:OTU domain-containing protein n=1 Tax=Candidatus Phytoplasma asiaticum TaxID=2763338 RepID=A0AAX3B8M3_9MOLU|nr:MULTISPECIES: hypothetical protein [Phytoplasma]MDO8058015.1 hypothetical protein ['Opuntia sp.' phytoplasma]UQV27022.1 hypothetical protein H7686_0001485 ['Parthenium hysterophorus' phyllody phytoplasma]